MDGMTPLPAVLPPTPSRHRASLPFAVRAGLWLLPFAVYAASPFMTAWTIKEAIKAGHAPTLERLVAWDSVRFTLRHSMKSLALDRPLADSVAADPTLASVEKPGLWQRVKGYIGSAAVDRLVDRYATSDGLPTLFSYGQSYKRYVKGEAEAPKTLANLPDRMKAFWARIRHVEFVTPTQFEIEVEDKADPTRRFTGLLEFRDLRWQLTELYVHSSKRPLGRLAALMAARNPDER